jgi:CBS domain-containing protein
MYAHLTAPDTARSPADPVSTIMSSPVAEITGRAGFVQVAETLAAAEVGALVVVDGATALGVVSERDLVRTLAEGRVQDDLTAADLVSPETVWAAPTDTIGTVADLMADAEVRHIPLRAGGLTVGMVSIRDILEVLRRGSEAS